MTHFDESTELTPERFEELAVRERMEHLRARAKKAEEDNIRLRGTLFQIAKWDDDYCRIAKTLHWDMRGWARVALGIEPLPDGQDCAPLPKAVNPVNGTFVPEPVPEQLSPTERIMRVTIRDLKLMPRPQRDAFNQRAFHVAGFPTLADVWTNKHVTVRTDPNTPGDVLFLWDEKETTNE
jgi:hypothetical protein